MLDFICIGSVDLRGARGRRKIHNETKNPYPQWDSNQELAGFENSICKSYIYRSLTVMRTKSGCMLKANTGLLRLLLFVQFRYIPLCNTIQYVYKTKYALLRHTSNLYQCRESTCMYKGHFKRSFHQALQLLAQSVEALTTIHKVVSSSPSMGKNFSFLYFFAFNTFLAGRQSPYKWNQAWYSSKVISA